MKIKRVLCLILIFTFCLSSFALADFSSTDSNHLTTIYTRSGNIYSALVDQSGYVVNIEDTLVNYILPKLTSINSRVNDIADYTAHASDRLYDYQHNMSAAQLLYSIDRRLTSSGNDNATWLELINSKVLTASNRLSSGGNSVAAWSELINNKVFSIQSILEAEKDKQESALDDYSSSGGRSASDVSSDMGNISGSVSSNLDSGVSMDKALTAVDDNDSYFHYFFFEMKDDLDTPVSSGSRGPLRSAPASGSDVPDFLSDYWGGLNG